MMITEKKITQKTTDLIRSVETSLPADVEAALKVAYKGETNKIAKIQLDQILKNISFARRKKIPICQDTGLLTFYVSVGEKPNIRISEIRSAIDKAVALSTDRLPLRKNSVDALTRKPLNKNVPIIHFSHVPKKKHLEITLLAKGAGSENVTRFSMLAPTTSEDKIIDFIVDSVKRAGGLPCPPIILGIGIGGTAEEAIILSKKALLSPINKTKKTRIEKKLLEKINALNIGTMGLGGRVTCLGVKVNTAPAHTASLPVAVTFSCWALRRGTVILK